MLDVAQLAPAAATSAEDAHVEELLQHEVLVLLSERVRGVEVGEAVGELAHGAAQLVVLAVVVTALDGVAPHHGSFPVVIVRLVRVEVDLVGGEPAAAAGAVGGPTFLSSFCSWCLSLRTMAAVRSGVCRGVFYKRRGGRWW